MRSMPILTAALGLSVSGLAIADDHEGDFAQNSVNVGLNPFGSSINYGYAFSGQTNLQFTIGGLPSTELATFDIDGTDYTVTSGSSWTGAFINHRPVADADWFRLNFGIGIGVIRNNFTDADGNTYDAVFSEAPVGYTGIGFGFRPKKGLQYGLDIGLLFGSGPTVTPGEGNTSDAADAIAASPLSADILPNFQLGIGWGF